MGGRLMKVFYKILWGNPPIQGVGKWEAADFDITSLWKGNPFHGPIPAKVRLYISKEDESHPRPDILPNPVSWLIISDHLLDIWGPLLGDDVQVFDAPIYYESDKRSCEGYHIINPLRVVDAIDWEQSTISRYDDGAVAYFPKMVLKNDYIGKVNIFRLKDYFPPIIVSTAMVKNLKKKKCKGLAFLKIQAL